MDDGKMNIKIGKKLFKTKSSRFAFLYNIGGLDSFSCYYNNSFYFMEHEKHHLVLHIYTVFLYLKINIF